jgi:quinol monooxygenase YgiN
MSYKVMLESKIKLELKKPLFIFLEENLPNVRSFNGCMSVTVLFNEDTGDMLFDEEWKSKEHHQAYLSFIQDNGVLADLAAFLQGPPIINYYTKIEI